MNSRLNPLSLDLATTAFSRRGSYFAVSHITDTPDPGIYLRTVRGNAANREIAQLRLDEKIPSWHATAGRLDLASGTAHARLVLDGTSRVQLRIDSGTLALDFEARSQYDVVLEESEHTWRFIDSGANHNYRIQVFSGRAHFETNWDGTRNREAHLLVSSSAEPADVVIDEFDSSVPTDLPKDIDQLAAAAEQDFEAWFGLHGVQVGADERLTTAAHLAAFVDWAALVPPGGLLRRESMLMSKNKMTNIWSWDHCFNAMALWRDPEAAAGQLFTIFDHQDEYGCLPDYVNDAGTERNFVKPPIHGWSIDFLMDRHGLTDPALTALYGPLTRWTQWWFEYRVYGTDGVPSYNHGNDSGWDNSTVFSAGVPVQSPDLLAFLAVQMHTLGRMAHRLGLADDEAWWLARAEETVATMCDHFWVDGRFVARRTVTQEIVDSNSLLLAMPIVCGKMLPEPQRTATIGRLLDSSVLTTCGFATEPVDSPWYEADGYWRGPVWAPSTMLLVDGLRRSGRADVADDVADRFVDLCAGAGMAENFDAGTGAGLRDGSMTWTASVFMILAGDRRQTAKVGPYRTHTAGSAA